MSSEGKAEHPILRGTGILGTVLGIAALDPALAIAGSVLWWVHRKQKPHA